MKILTLEEKRRIDRILAQVSENMPEHLKRGLMRTEVLHDEREIAEQALQSKYISPERKAMLRAGLKAGTFYKDEQVVDDEIAKEIDRYFTITINRLVRDGIIPDPATIYDPFVASRNKS